MKVSPMRTASTPWSRRTFVWSAVLMPLSATKRMSFGTSGLVEEAISSGIEDILIISGHAKRAIEDHFDSAPILEAELKAKGKTKLLEMVQETSEINVHYIRQKHMRGLGDAILCARAFIDNEPFAVLLGDDIVYNPEMPALKQLMDMYNQTGATILGCQQVPKEKVSSYGIVAGVPTINEQLMKVNDMIEKPSIEEAPSQMAVLGRYIITPDVFEVLQNTKPGKGGEIQLTDALKVMAKREKEEGAKGEIVKVEVKLSKEDINVEVLNVVKAAKETGKVVTVEEHSVIGGLGSAVCDVLSEQLPTPVLKIGVNDVFGHSGPAVELIKEFGLDGDSIAAKVKEFVK